MVNEVPESRGGSSGWWSPPPTGDACLARPNGLAGWILPSIAVTLPVTDWDEAMTERAGAIVGAAVEPVRRLAPDAWVVRAAGRISSAGTTWVTHDDAARLGVDAAVVRQWAVLAAAEAAEG